MRAGRWFSVTAFVSKDQCPVLIVWADTADAAIRHVKFRVSEAYGVTMTDVGASAGMLGVMGGRLSLLSVYQALPARRLRRDLSGHVYGPGTCDCSRCTGWTPHHKGAR